MIDPFHYPSPSPKLPSSTSLPVSHSSLLFLQKTENKLAGTGTLGFCRRTMGDALLELEQVLRSSKHKLTDEEVNVLRVCRGKASRDFTITACISSGVVWTVTQRLRYALRINLSAGAAILSGLWRFDRSLDSCLDHILALQGSRMQKELANIILTKYQDNPWRMQLINKHFFPEKVFDDSDVDKPISRWRHRNFFGDNVANNQRAHYTETHSDRTDFEPKQFTDALLGSYNMQASWEVGSPGRYQ
uniref:Uncharacterized protein n=1 Tax=Nelumbo nucifera TaxID=4432 RepID=A0A822XKV7_NELNU|nr:TPA_asm: hypothetical protein HUJ06_021039 [Nelumbo nucifera]